MSIVEKNNYITKSDDWFCREKKVLVFYYVFFKPYAMCDRANKQTSKTHLHIAGIIRVKFVVVRIRIRHKNPYRSITTIKYGTNRYNFLLENKYFHPSSPLTHTIFPNRLACDEPSSRRLRHDGRAAVCLTDITHPYGHTC